MQENGFEVDLKKTEFIEASFLYLFYAEKCFYEVVKQMQNESAKEQQ